MSRKAQTWAGLLWTIGGSLNLKKCFWYGLHGNGPQWGMTEFAQPYVHMDIQSVFCQLSTSSGFTWLKEIFPENTILPEVTTGDAHLRLHLPPSFSQDTLLVI